MWPSDDVLLTAWQGLVADPDTAGAFVSLVIEPLQHDLSRQFRHVSADDVTTAAEDAILALLRRPTAYDPTRASLPAFLRLAARRDLLNLLDKERKHRRGRIPWEHVELDHPDRNVMAETCSLVDEPSLQAAIASLSPEDRRVLDLMRDGEREMAIFATALEVASLPVDEQVAAVKRAKDRIKARLKRAGGGT